MEEVKAEQQKQLDKWGVQTHPNGTGAAVDLSLANGYKSINAEAVRTNTLTWRLILMEEVYEAMAENDPATLRAELIQVAAVCATWIEALERNKC